MTWREYRTRLAWLEMREAEPSRSDFYAMQIAMEVRRVLAKNPNQIKLKHFKLDFEDKEKPKVDYKKLAPYSIANWRGAIMGAWKQMTGSKKKPLDPPPEAAKAPTPILQRKRRGAR